MTAAFEARSAGSIGRQLADLVRLAAPFGGLIVFWTLVAVVDVKSAIAGAMAFILLDTLRLWHGGLGFTRLWLLSSALTMVFGAIDLSSAAPFMLAYESVITNAATGLAFVGGASGRKSIMQTLAEQRRGPYPERADIRRFFQIFTLLWAVYFFVKAALYFWAAWTLPLTEAMGVRTLVGPVSLVVLSALSFSQGDRLFALCKRLRLLPAPDAFQRSKNQNE
jgi:intracellular septation protein A